MSTTLPNNDNMSLPVTLSELPAEAARTNTAPVDAHGTLNGTREVNAAIHELSLHASVPVVKVPRTLESLPAELKLKILSNLPICEVQGLQNINEAFRALIKENENTITQKSIASSLAGLEDFIKTHITYNAKNVDGESAFMTALTAFVKHRGLVAPGMCMEWLVSLEAFTVNWRFRLALAKAIESKVMTPEEYIQVEAEVKSSIKHDPDTEVWVDTAMKASINLSGLHFSYNVDGYQMSPEDNVRSRKCFLSTGLEVVGLETISQMQAILLQIENGVWTGVRLFPECPVTCCTYDQPPSSYGIYASRTFGDYASEDDDSEDDTESESEDEDEEEAGTERQAHEEQQRAAETERAAREERAAEVGWTVVGPSRRTQKHVAAPQNNAPPNEQAPRIGTNAYRESLPEDEKAGYDKFMEQPIHIDVSGIAHDPKALEGLDEKFQRMFGVPSLFAEIMPFRYFVKSEWAYNKVQAVLQGKVEMSSWDKAAVLEELYMY